jgi:hypothetical protein
MKEFHILNLGAGVQSTVLYLMARANHRAHPEAPKPYPRVGPISVAIFADTQEEPAAVYQHLAWLQSLNSIAILVRSKGKLGDHLKRGVNSTGQRFASIPGFNDYGADDSSQARRQCSSEYKIKVIERCIKREIIGLLPRKRVPKDVCVTQYIGISLDESGRAERIRRRRNLGQTSFPLIDSYMTRQDCLDWLTEHAQVPHEVPRSACVFCPYHSDEEWLHIKGSPADWDRAVEIDEALRIPGNVVNRNMDSAMYLHRSCKPLVQIDFSAAVTLPVQPSMGFYRECLGVCGL